MLLCQELNAEEDYCQYIVEITLHLVQ